MGARMAAKARVVGASTDHDALLANLEVQVAEAEAEAEALAAAGGGAAARGAADHELQERVATVLRATAAADGADDGDDSDDDIPLRAPLVRPASATAREGPPLPAAAPVGDDDRLVDDSDDEGGAQRGAGGGARAGSARAGGARVGEFQAYYDDRSDDDSPVRLAVRQPYLDWQREPQRRPRRSLPQLAPLSRQTSWRGSSDDRGRTAGGTHQHRKSATASAAADGASGTGSAGGVGGSGVFPRRSAGFGKSASGYVEPGYHISYGSGGNGSGGSGGGGGRGGGGGGGRGSGGGGGKRSGAMGSGAGRRPSCSGGALQRLRRLSSSSPQSSSQGVVCHRKTAAKFPAPASRTGQPLKRRRHRRADRPKDGSDAGSDDGSDASGEDSAEGSGSGEFSVIDSDDSADEVGGGEVGGEGSAAAGAQRPRRRIAPRRIASSRSTSPEPDASWRARAEHEARRAVQQRVGELLEPVEAAALCGYQEVRRSFVLRPDGSKAPIALGAADELPADFDVVNYDSLRAFYSGGERGYGVCCTEPIRKWQIVGEACGRVISEAEFTQLVDKTYAPLPQLEPPASRLALSPPHLSRAARAARLRLALSLIGECRAVGAGCMKVRLLL